MDKTLDMLYELCEITTRKLEESTELLKKSQDMSVSDIDLVDKLTHALKCIKTTIAMMEADEEEDGGSSERSYAYRGRTMRSRDGGSYADGGYSGRRMRSPRTGRYVSRDGGYSGHDGIEDIMMDVQEMPESERRKLKSMLERM